jgi:hypothetical protein
LPVPVAVNAILLCIGGLGLGVGQPMTMSWLAASALKCTRPLVSSRSWSTYSGRAAPARPDPPRSPPTSRPAEQADHPLSDELLDRLGQAPDLDAAAVVWARRAHVSGAPIPYGGGRPASRRSGCRQEANDPIAASDGIKYVPRNAAVGSWYHTPRLPAKPRSCHPKRLASLAFHSIH